MTWEYKRQEPDFGSNAKRERSDISECRTYCNIRISACYLNRKNR